MKKKIEIEWCRLPFFQLRAFFMVFPLLNFIEIVEFKDFKNRGSWFQSFQESLAVRRRKIYFLVYARPEEISLRHEMKSE